MRKIAFKAVDINGKPLGTRVLNLGSSVGNTFAEETKVIHNVSESSK